MAQHGDYVVFQFTAPNNVFGFRTYNNDKGQATGFLEGKDKEGLPIYRRWKFDKDVRKISVHKDKTDLEGKKAVDFLRNSPNCKGSPNGTYTSEGDQLDVYFEEVNESKAAEKGIEFETLRINAQNAALKVKGQDFIDLCALIGVFNKDESVMRFSLLEYAKNKPQSFMEIYDDPRRQLKSLIRRAVKTNVFNLEGKAILWENKLIGTDEEDAVATLKGDENLLKAVKANLDKVK
ncbi:MAG TPA: hypothetical protein VGD26_00960 [Chitinophagaceae bacterium]